MHLLFKSKVQHCNHVFQIITNTSINICILIFRMLHLVLVSSIKCNNLFAKCLIFENTQKEKIRLK